MTRILITGASGLLGANLAVAAAAEHDVVAVGGSRPPHFPGVRGVATDLSTAGAARSLLERHQPDWVIHCAAATDLERCEREPDWAQALNVELPRKLAVACRDLGIRLAHISTDSVFDGESRSAYGVADEPNPVNVYAHSKLQGERAVQQVLSEATIVRTNFFGWSLTPRHSLAEWFLERLERGEPTPGFTDVYFSPLVVDHLATLLLDLMERRVTGLVHLPGSDCVSKHEFGLRLAATFDLDATLVRRSTIAESKLEVRRPLRTCLDGTLTAAMLERPLPQLEDGLRVLRESRKERAALRGAQPRLEELAHESD